MEGVCVCVRVRARLRQSQGLVPRQDPSPPTGTLILTSPEVGPPLGRNHSSLVREIVGTQVPGSALEAAHTEPMGALAQCTPSLASSLSRWGYSAFLLGTGMRPWKTSPKPNPFTALLRSPCTHAPKAFASLILQREAEGPAVFSGKKRGELAKRTSRMSAKNSPKQENFKLLAFILP